MGARGGSVALKNLNAESANCVFKVSNCDLEVLPNL